MSQLILMLSVIFVVGFMLNVCSRTRSGRIVIPPLVSAMFLFSVCIVLILVLEISAVHLLWLFPLCLVIGFVLLVFPIVQKIVLGFVLLISYPIK